MVAKSGLAATPDHPDLLEAAGTAVWWLGDRKEVEKLLARARDLRPWLNRQPVRVPKLGQFFTYQFSPRVPARKVSGPI